MNKISSFFKEKLSIGLLAFYLFYFILTILVSNNGFFWDTTQLSSEQAHFFFENNLKIAHLPDEIDSGHIPVFGYVLALIWTIFGYSLEVSHFLMLPFLLGIVYQLNQLFSTYFKSSKKYLAMLFVLVDPTLLAQSVLITPDIPLTFLLFLTLNGIIRKKKAWVLLGTIGLSLISMRGWEVAFVLFLFEWIENIDFRDKTLKTGLQILIPYLPSGIIAILFLVSHYITKGWIVYHDASPWAPCFEKVGLGGFVYNIGIYIWRLIDFNRLIIWLLLAFFSFKILKGIKKDAFLRKTVILSTLFLVLFPISMLTHAQLLQHRYLLPVYLSVSILLSYFVVKYEHIAYSYVVIVILLVGNLIIYPDKVAQGWDASLAHIPYYSLRRKACQFMDKEEIDESSVKTWFPNLAKSKYIDLKQGRGFTEAPLSQCKYCFYSNIFNGVSDADYNTINASWNIIYNDKLIGVKVQIFKNPTFDE